MQKSLLLISNSTNPGGDYLGWPQEYIKSFLDKHGIRKVLFIPYAGITVSYDDYTSRVRAVFNKLGFDLYSIHKETEPLKAIMEAEAIATGGGNTFRLVHILHMTGQMQAIRERAMSGVPYLGWSAGSNVACPSMKTTNDMPVVEPGSFDCMGLIPFQINPHYLDAHPEGHGGETREQRIQEFLILNPDIYVVGLRESSLLEIQGADIELKGRNGMRVFKAGLLPEEYLPGKVNWLLGY